MPARIRIQVDRIGADLAADRLRQDGIPVEVVSDDDRSVGMSFVGVPMLFSLVVPSQYEERARRVLSSASDRAASRPRRSLTRQEARARRRR